MNLARLLISYFGIAFSTSSISNKTFRPAGGSAVKKEKKKDKKEKKPY